VRLCFGVGSLQLWKWVSLSLATEMAGSLCIVRFLCGWAVSKTVVTVFAPSPSLPGLEQQPTVWGVQSQIHYPRKSYVVLIRYDLTYSHRTVPRDSLLPLWMPQNKILDFVTRGWFRSCSVQWTSILISEILRLVVLTQKAGCPLCALLEREVKSLLWMCDFPSMWF